MNGILRFLSIWAFVFLGAYLCNRWFNVEIWKTIILWVIFMTAQNIDRTEFDDNK